MQTHAETDGVTRALAPPLPSGALSQIFEAILSFCKAQDELYLALLEHKAAARQHAQEVALLRLPSAIAVP